MTVTHVTKQPKSNMQTQLKKIWVMVNKEEGLRDGEKARIFENLKEIKFMWGVRN